MHAHRFDKRVQLFDLFQRLEAASIEIGKTVLMKGAALFNLDFAAGANVYWPLQTTLLAISPSLLTKYARSEPDQTAQLARYSMASVFMK